MPAKPANKVERAKVRIIEPIVVKAALSAFVKILSAECGNFPE
jgi:hypothetical protein